MLSPYDIQNISRDVSEIYAEVENEVVKQLVEAVKNNANSVPKKYYVQKLNDAGTLNANLVETVRKATQASKMQVINLVTTAILKGTEEDYAKEKGKLFKALITSTTKKEENTKKALFENIKQMEEVAKTTLNLTGNALVNSGAEAYRELIANAYVKASTGIVPLQQAIDEAVESLGNDGLYITYESGYRCTVDSAIRRDIVTNINRQVGNQTIDNCEFLGYDLVETSWHVGARPEHEVWQGKIFSLSGKSDKYPPFKESTGWGDITGICGINCRHSFYPYAEGAVEMDKSAKPTAEENLKAYKAEQTARLFEKQMRQARRTIVALNANGKDSSDWQTEYNKLNRAYGKFCKENNLARQSFRVGAGSNLDIERDAEFMELQKQYEEWKEKGEPASEVKKPSVVEKAELRTGYPEKPWEEYSERRTEVRYNYTLPRSVCFVLNDNRYSEEVEGKNITEVNDPAKLEAKKKDLPFSDKDGWQLVRNEDNQLLIINKDLKLAYHTADLSDALYDIDKMNAPNIRQAWEDGSLVYIRDQYIASGARSGRKVNVEKIATSDFNALVEKGIVMPLDEYLKKEGKESDIFYMWVEEMQDKIGTPQKFNLMFGNGNEENFTIYINNNDTARDLGEADPLSNFAYVRNNTTGELVSWSEIQHKDHVFLPREGGDEGAIEKYLKFNMDSVYGRKKNYKGEWTESLNTGIATIVKNAQEDEFSKNVKTYLDKAVYQAMYSDERDGTYYEYMKDSVNIDATFMRESSDRGFTVPFHELGHMVDHHVTGNGEWSEEPLMGYQYSYDYKNSEFGDHALLKALEKDVENSSFKMLTVEYRFDGVFREEMDKGDYSHFNESREMILSFKDTLQGASNGKIYTGTHTKDYFSDRRKATTEFFAEMGQIATTTKPKEMLAIMESYFPNGVKVYKEMVANMKFLKK